MKCKKKARGLTIIGVIVGVAFACSAIPTAVHLYAQQRAQDRLDAILTNLAGIDIGIAQWKRGHSFLIPVKSDLDGSGGDIAKVVWPTGPVPGSYSISPENYRAWISAAHRGIPASATFDGGNKGSMNRPEWQRTCGADPTSCGL